MFSFGALVLEMLELRPHIQPSILSEREMYVHTCNSVNRKKNDKEVRKRSRDGIEEKREERGMHWGSFFFFFWCTALWEYCDTLLYLSMMCGYTLCSEKL